MFNLSLISGEFCNSPVQIFLNCIFVLQKNTSFLINTFSRALCDGYLCTVIFQKIYEKHVTFGGEGGSLEEPRYVTKGGGGSESGLKKATWFVYGP